jgi:hypothetical protein
VEPVRGDVGSLDSLTTIPSSITPQLLVAPPLASSLSRSGEGKVTVQRCQVPSKVPSSAGRAPTPMTSGALEKKQRPGVGSESSPPSALHFDDSLSVDSLSDMSAATGTSDMTSSTSVYGDNGLGSSQGSFVTDVDSEASPDRPTSQIPFRNILSNAQISPPLARVGESSIAVAHPMSFFTPPAEASSSTGNSATPLVETRTLLGDFSAADSHKPAASTTAPRTAVPAPLDSQFAPVPRRPQSLSQAIQDHDREFTSLLSDFYEEEDDLGDHAFSDVDDDTFALPPSVGSKSSKGSIPGVSAPEGVRTRALPAEPFDLPATATSLRHDVELVYMDGDEEEIEIHVLTTEQKGLKAVVLESGPNTLTFEYNPASSCVFEVDEASVDDSGDEVRMWFAGMVSVRVS